MSDLGALPSRKDGKLIHAMVESPRGSNMKLKWDPALRVMKMGRPLPRGVTFPADWGFIPSTLAPDDDPLDAIILHDADMWPGVLVPCRILGVLLATQRSKSKGHRIHNDRVICTPEKSPSYENIRNVNQLPKRVKAELENFFHAAVALEDKELKLEGWMGPQRALQILRQCEDAARFPSS